jgi:hypothetical protein
MKGFGRGYTFLIAIAFLTSFLKILEEGSAFLSPHSLTPRGHLCVQKNKFVNYFFKLSYLTMKI